MSFGVLFSYSPPADQSVRVYVASLSMGGGVQVLKCAPWQLPDNVHSICSFTEVQKLELTYQM